jgi:hypothetical protein
LNRLCFENPVRAVAGCGEDRGEAICPSCGVAEEGDATVDIRTERAVERGLRSFRVYLRALGG